LGLNPAGLTTENTESTEFRTLRKMRGVIQPMKVDWIITSS